MLVRFGIVVVLAVAVVILSSRRAPADVATWYGPESGTHTANGERYNPEARTCAHRTIAFNTLLRVTYRGRSVVCRVNDRGPAQWTGASIDLSRGTARAIGMMSAGRGRVTIERE
ncbi:MAG: septal ring lytic transglycosylase RlpA family protein [Afipia sp.]